MSVESSLTKGVPTGTEIVVVELRAGAVCRPVLVWGGTRTQVADRLVAGFDAFPRRQKFLDASQTAWRSEHELPVGAVVTTASRELIESELRRVTRAGLEPISYAAAWHLLDPSGAEERALHRAHDAFADEAGLPRELSRFVGAHTLRNGVHRAGDSYVYAERCTARQAFWRRATRDEVAALKG